MASRIILDPETLLAQAGEMQSLTAEYESLFSKVTGTLNDTNNNWSELLAHNFAGKISSAQQSFASITELLASGAAAAKNSATTMQSVDQSLFKVFGGEAGAGISSGQVQGVIDVIEDYRKAEKTSKKVKAKSKKKKDGFLDSLKAVMAGVSKAIVKKGKMPNVLTNSPNRSPLSLSISAMTIEITTVIVVKTGYRENIGINAYPFHQFPKQIESI